MSTEERRDALRAAFTPITEALSTAMAKNFSKVYPFLNTSFGQYELDAIHHEICYCLLLDLTQASITLTNHLLEKHLKLLLIYNEKGRDRQAQSLNDLNDLYGEASAQYGSLDLNDTINRCCTRGLISKEDKKHLHKYREVFRNGFSHADMSKIFGDAKIPLAMGSFTDPSRIETGEFRVADIPLLQGVAQKQVADTHAFEYYQHVYQIIQASLNKGE
jgi:hypothetical protein